jgi:methyl-accepting chemotaxis protein
MLLPFRTRAKRAAVDSSEADATNAEVVRLRQMLDQMPVNVMVCDSRDGRITYVNKTSRDTLATLGATLPVPLDRLVGQKMDLFHKNPERQRALLADRANLPHQARVSWGEHVLDLRASPLTDENGAYNGVLMTWSVATPVVRMIETFENSVKGIVDVVSSASTQLQATAEGLSSASNQLASAITEISKQVNEATRIASDGAMQAQEANAAAVDLARKSDDVGAVVGAIGNVAGQTNMLALNATIEAARAGEAGKGFAVVAGEVKQLANQTSKAASEITQQIGSMLEGAGSAATRMEKLASMMGDINEVTTSIASAIEEQSASTRETGRSADDVLAAARELSKQAETLRGEVDRFLEKMREM